MVSKLTALSAIGLVALAANARYATVSAQDQPKRIEIIAKRFEYQPSELTVKKGEPIVLVLKSEDVPHGLRFRDLNLDIKVGKEESSEVQFTPDRVGDFTGRCWVFCGEGHGHMMMTLHVVN